jgi:hypothetical protein
LDPTHLKAHIQHIEDEAGPLLCTSPELLKSLRLPHVPFLQAADGTCNNNTTAQGFTNELLPELIATRNPPPWFAIQVASRAAEASRNWCNVQLDFDVRP